MTTRVIVMANHGETGETHVHVQRREAGEFLPDESPMVIKGPNQWREIWLPDNAQIIVLEPRE